MSENFDEFIAYCRKYINTLNLNDWDVMYEYCEIDKANAQCCMIPETRKATIRLATNLQDGVSVKDCALHECLELLLGDIALYMEDFYSTRLVNDEIHRIINRLMPVIYKP